LRGTIPQRLGVRSPTADKAVDDQPDVSSVSQTTPAAWAGIPPRDQAGALCLWGLLYFGELLIKPARSETKCLKIRVESYLRDSGPLIRASYFNLDAPQMRFLSAHIFFLDERPSGRQKVGVFNE